VAAETPATPAAAVEPEPVADVPVVAEVLSYMVKGGDSAIKISRQFGVDVEALLVANKIGNRNHIEPGQILTIPG
jgi:nucleoid-associated protein YgaU